jgi:hypothetical protein
MAMAGELLTPQQRVLWKLYDQHGGVRFMSDSQLADWALACRTLMDNAGTRPLAAKKARALWRKRLVEAEAALAERQVESG